MKNKDGKIGSILIITFIIIAMAVVGFLVFTIINTDTDINIDKNTIKDINDKKKKEEKELANKESKDSFSKVISSLEYISLQRYIDYEPIYVNGSDYKKLYNPIDKNLIVDKLDEDYKWYGSFGIVYGDVNKVIDNTGKVLFSSREDINYYEKSSTWIYKNSLFNKTGEIKEYKKIIMIDNNNHNYFLVVDDKKLEIIDKDGKVTYEKELNESINYLNGEMDSIYDRAYALVNYNNLYGVIDPTNGKIIIDFINEEIEKKDNVFYTSDKTYFIKDDKKALELSKKVKNIEVSSKYIALDNNVYNVSDLSSADSNTYISSDSYLENKTGLERIACRIGYGLKYNGEKVLDCSYDDIIYFDDKIVSALLNSNKLYVVTKIDDDYQLYDVINKKVVIESIIDYEVDSQFMEVFNGIDTYIFNIITNKESYNESGDSIEFGYNYYALLTGGKISYYNKDDELIYEGKV